MSAGTYDITIEQGATWELDFTWYEYDADNPPLYQGDPIDLTNYTARMHIRRRKSSSDYLIELTTENGGITLGGEAGTVSLVISSEDTANMLFGTGFYDIEMVVGDRVTRIMEGEVTLSKEVTR